MSSPYHVAFPSSGAGHIDDVQDHGPRWCNLMEEQRQEHKRAEMLAFPSSGTGHSDDVRDHGPRWDNLMEDEQEKHERAEMQIQELQKRADIQRWMIINAQEKQLQQQMHEMHNLHALFGFYGINKNDCESFCDCLGIQRTSDLGILRFPEDFVYVRNNILECTQLLERVTLCFNEFKSCKFDFKEFSRRHIPVLTPRPVRLFPLSAWEPETLEDFLERVQYERNESKEYTSRR